MMMMKIIIIIISSSLVLPEEWPKSKSFINILSRLSWSYIAKGKFPYPWEVSKLHSTLSFELESSAASTLFSPLFLKTKVPHNTVCPGVSLSCQLHSGLWVKCPSEISSIKTRSEAICEHQNQLEDTSVSNYSSVIHHLMTNLYW